MNAHSGPNSTAMLSPLRRQLLNWFKAEAAPLADSYEGAVRLLNDSTFPGRLHFIAHAVRDIADRLAFVLDPTLDGTRVQYESSLDSIGEKWPRIEGLDDEADDADMRSHIEIDFDLALLIDKLVTDHRERRTRPSQFELLFRTLARREPSRAGFNRRLVKDFKAMRGWFMKHAHLRADGVAMVDEEELQSRFSSFEGILHSFVGDFFTGTSALDEILHEANQEPS